MFMKQSRTEIRRFLSEDMCFTAVMPSLVMALKDTMNFKMLMSPSRSIYAC